MPSASAAETSNRLDDQDPADIAIARDQAAQRRRRWRFASLILVAIGVGYVLCPGILRSLSRNNLLPPAIEPIIEVVLYPLEWAYQHSELINWLYNRYFVLIGVDE